MLDEIFEKINDSVAGATTHLIEKPGKTIISGVETGLGLNQPLSPAAWVVNGIRGGIGNSYNNNNSTILTDPRNTDGSFKTNWTDQLFRVTPEKKKEKALSVLKNNKDYKALRLADYDFTDDKGNVKSNDDIEAAVTLTDTPMYQKYEAEGGDTTQLDLSNTNTAQLSKLLKEQIARNTIERLGGSTGGLSGQQLIGEADRLTTQRKNEDVASDPLNAAQIRSVDAGIKRDKERAALDLLSVENELALGQSNIDLKKATALMQADQQRLDREYLDRADLREYNYRIRKDDQDQMDKIFALLLGGVDKIF